MELWAAYVYVWARIYPPFPKTWQWRQMQFADTEEGVLEGPVPLLHSLPNLKVQNFPQKWSSKK